MSKKIANKKSYKLTIILAVLLVLCSIGSMLVGAMNLSVSELLKGNTQQLQILILSRFPRLMAILCTGAGMSIAGLIMQQLCMNKFVAPSTGATISSAQLGILISMIFFRQATLMQRTAFAFVAALIGTCIFVFFMQKVRYKDIIMVPLVGIMFGNVISGITGYLSYKHDLSQSLSAWLQGDFSLVIQGRYEIVYLVLPLIVIAFIFANYFNIVGMGEEFSKNLGVPYTVVLFSGLAIAAMISASVVVVVGSISYIGLIVPNMVSMFKGDRIRGNIIDTALTGCLFVLVCDVIGRVIIYPYELPINLIAGIIGSVLFIAMLIKKLDGDKANGKTGRLQMIFQKLGKKKQVKGELS